MYKPYKESKSIYMYAHLSVWRIMTSSIAHTLCFSHSSVRVSFLSNTNSDNLLRVNCDIWIYIETAGLNVSLLSAQTLHLSIL